MSQPTPIFDPSCMDDYDPNSLPADEALRRIHASIEPLVGTEYVNLRAGLNRVLAEPVRSPINVPAHTNSAMDGYAFNAAALEDEQIELRIAGTSWAGRPHLQPVANSECVRIMTGAVMPEGTDTVVIQERVDAVQDRIVFPRDTLKVGENVRDAGEDLKADDIILEPGQRLGPAELGMLASVGVVEVPVRRKLRVAFFSTGDELRSLGEPLDVGSIYDSNRYTLFGMLTRLGAEIVDMGVVRDRKTDVERALREASEVADAIITSGGVSVGEADFIKEMLEETGQVHFWKIAMKPGRPLAFGKVDNAYFFGLPGNPVSVMVTYYQFVQSALRQLSGEPLRPPTRFKARCISRLKKRGGRIEYQRGILEPNAEGEMVVRSTGGQGSGILNSMHQGNCFVILAMENEGVEPGEMVEVEPFFGVM